MHSFLLVAEQAVSCLLLITSADQIVLPCEILFCRLVLLLRGRLAMMNIILVFPCR